MQCEIRPLTRTFKSTPENAGVASVFMGKVTKIKIEDLVFDDQNANIGTDDGKELIESSIQNLGLGRSVLVDKNNKLIAGNKTTSAAIANGFTKAIIVETDGDEMVVVRRNDLNLDDMNDQRARAMALADNRTAQVNLAWNTENMKIHFDAVTKMDMGAMIFDLNHNIDMKDKPAKAQKDLSGNIDSVFKIEIEFQSEQEQEQAFNSLTELGYECRVLTL